MRLSQAAKRAGVIAISPLRNANGSYTAVVDLDKIDRESNGTNFREFKESHVNEIAANFNPQAVRNPVLVWDGKRLKSIDGRHTIALLQSEAAGSNHKWTAEIHNRISDAEVAAIFYELTQNSKRMGPWDAYAAALQGKYKFARDIQRALDKHGFSTPNDDGFNQKTADFDGFTPLVDSHKKGNRFLDAFLVVLGAWKHGNSRLQAKARLNPFQRGLIDFLTEHLGDYSARDLKAFLMKRSAAEIGERAADFDKQTGGTRPDRGHYKMAFESVMGIGANRRAAA